MLGGMMILLCSFAFANDLGRLDRSSRYDDTLRKTTSKDLEDQWRTPVNNEVDWRQFNKPQQKVMPEFDNYEIDDVEKFRDTSSYENTLSDRNPTLFGLKLKF
jgi:hypothetical protein